MHPCFTDFLCEHVHKKTLNGKASFVSCVLLFFVLFHIFLLNYLWLFVAFGNCDKWSNSEQISKSNNFKLWSVCLTNGKAGKILSAQGCCSVVKLLEFSHTQLCEMLTVGHQVLLGRFHWQTIAKAFTVDLVLLAGVGSYFCPF